ncbi:cdp-alcohol phosphatidyltransferase [Paramyrothecium foliicola]|nr:cdp-alcohol phosphatidyltransferase [Paramyrothecium foliicola]
MLSLRSTILAAATLSATAIAQSTLRIDPQSVDEGTRERWCDDQMRTCPFICEQTEPRTTEQNDCWPETLDYVCICGDGKAANLTEYSLTLPYYICQEYGNQCVKACNGNNSCASDCRENNPCGAQDPQRANSTSTSATTEPTSSSSTAADDGTTIFTGTPGGDDEDSEGSSSGSGSGNGGSGAGTLNSAGALSMAVIIGGLFAGFAML